MANKKYDEEEGVWRTIGGRRVFIRKGQSLSDAMRESGKFKKVSDVKRGEYQDAEKELKADKTDYLVRQDAKEQGAYTGDMTNEVWAGKHVENGPNSYKERTTSQVNDEYNELGKNIIPSEEQNDDDLHAEFAQYLHDKEGYSWEKITQLEGKEETFNKVMKMWENSPERNEYKKGKGETSGLSENETEVEKYYSKLSQFQARQDLDMRKSWLDDNVYDESKRKEYEDFYNQGEKYYQEKYGIEKPFEYKESFNSYREKRDKLEGITRDELGNRIYDNMKDNTWTGKEYTNSEFLENLEDENWHTERKMLLDANLTEKQMEFVKNNTEFRNGSPSLDKEITNELIKGAKGEKYRTPKEIIAERNKAEIGKLKKELDIISKSGKYDDSGKTREGLENDYQTYVDKKEKYKQLTGQEYDDSNISIPYDKNKTYTFPNGTKIDQKLMKEWYSGQTPEKVKNDIEFEKRVLYDKSPSNRERANAQIKEMEKYYNSMEKYESRISDDFTTKEWKEGYGNNFGEGSWKGSKSNSGLYGKDLIKAIDDEVKKAYPEITTSRKTGRGGYTDSFSYDVMSSTKPLVRDIKDFSDTEINRLYNSGYNKNYYKTKDEFKNSLSKELKSGHFSINEYDIDNDYRLTPFGKSVFKDIAKVSNAYNYDESASQVDYYNTGHYMNLGIGKYDKPFELKESKATTKASTTALKNAYEEYKKTHKDSAMSFASFKKWYR